MTNVTKGEVTFEVRGKTFTFKLGTNAQAMIEAKVGKTMQKFIADKGGDIGATDIRMIIHAGLFRHHQLTEEEVGDLIDEVGADRIAEIMVEAQKSSEASATSHEKNNGEGRIVRPPMKAAKEQIGISS